jgi:hypothetical protein
LTENDIKTIIYGGIKELTQNSKYYYSGYRGHFTDEGKRVLIEMIDLYAAEIEKAISKADEERSKAMVINALKEEK